MKPVAEKDVLRKVFGSDSEDEDVLDTKYPGPAGLKLVKGWLCPFRQVSSCQLLCGTYNLQWHQAYTPARICHSFGSCA